LLPALFIELRWIIVSAAHPNASVASRESTFLEAFPSFFTSAKILLFIVLYALWRPLYLPAEVLTSEK
jgi:hypothetical protein